MSSLVRRIEKRILKARGLFKDYKLVLDKDGENPRPVQFVTDKDGNDYGPRWPSHLYPNARHR